MLVHEKLGIYKIRLPLPIKNLNHINSYGFKGSEGWYILDVGLNTEQTRLAWRKFMVDHGITGKDVKAIYVTHMHPDHFGAAGWLQGLTGAPVFIGSQERMTWQKVWQNNPEETVNNLVDMLISNGVPSHIALAATKDVNKMTALSQPIPEFNSIEPGRMVQLGDYSYRVLFTPGHSDGHICFFNEDFDVLLSGDHLLPRITPVISLWPNIEVNPLNSYLLSLQDNHHLSVKLALPAHGEAFANVKERILELQAHHENRLRLMKGLAAGGATAYSICQQVFGENLDDNDISLAVNETVAHLMYMVYLGELEVESRNGISIFGDHL